MYKLIPLFHRYFLFDEKSKFTSINYPNQRRNNGCIDKQAYDQFRGKTDVVLCIGDVMFKVDNKFCHSFNKDVVYKN